MPARVFSWLRVHHPGTPFVPPLGFVSRRRRAGSNSTDFWYRTFGVTSKILIVQCVNQSEKQRNGARETHVPNSRILQGLVILPHLHGFLPISKTVELSRHSRCLIPLRFSLSVSPSWETASVLKLKLRSLYSFNLSPPFLSAKKHLQIIII